MAPRASFRRFPTSTRWRGAGSSRSPPARSRTTGRSAGSSSIARCSCRRPRSSASGRCRRCACALPGSPTAPQGRRRPRDRDRPRPGVRHRRARQHTPVPGSCCSSSPPASSAQGRCSTSGPARACSRSPPAVLGFHPVLGLDNELESVQAARENAAVNGQEIEVASFDLRTGEPPLPRRACADRRPCGAGQPAAAAAGRPLGRHRAHARPI